MIFARTSVLYVGENWGSDGLGAAAAHLGVRLRQRTKRYVIALTARQVLHSSHYMNL